ncbi:MAG: DUF374 domain-containing protein [Rickettsiales bacterium]|jgi:lysophospholipid acyltransferase (LPLAT)-like uncharacterized protein|nr:DUF374 domain-containing protein [Rickettsiales bacterium]
MLKKTKDAIIDFVFGNAVMQWLTAAVFYFGIKLVWLLNKKEVRNDYIFREFSGRPAIWVVWHGRSMMMVPIVRKYRLRGSVITARSRDGKIMAKLQRLAGLKSISGSTKKGGVNVLRKGVRVLQSGNLVTLSPDGPRGPRMRLNDGCLYFAKMSGAPIIPVCYTTTKPWFQHRWDRYLIAKFFGKIIVSVGAPVYFDRKNPGEMTELHDKLEKIMVEQQQNLDREVGLPPIEPQAAK